ncbi:hypothetical protein [Streptomyces sp. NPDC003635]
MAGEYDALLEVLDFGRGEDAPRWRWRISDWGPSGEVYESPVDLTADAGGRPENYGFLADPSGFIQDTWLDAAGKANTLRRLGHWLRTAVLTQDIWDLLPLQRPATVLIRLNPDGPEREILRYPLVLAADDAGSLADRRVTFVYDVASGTSLSRRAEKDEPLHIIGVFNRSRTGEPLDLHAEQSQVFDAVRDIAADGGGMDITSRTLSYHVTHEQLRNHVVSAKRGNRQDEGRWQLMLHLADRGVPGSWSAVAHGSESATKAPLSAAELVGMLQTSDNDRRLRLAVITTRPASSPSIADQLNLFRIPSHLAPEPHTTANADADADRLAVDLAGKLGCAVLAFRHRIGDQAAVDFVTEVYGHLLSQNLTLPRAVGAAMATCPSLTTLDRAAPVIYGAEACGLVVQPPPLFRPDAPTREHPPPSLIGHHDPMWQASEIFARIGGSGVNGVVLHGMAGVGKTTCADELISQYAHRYRNVVRYPLKGRRMDDEPWDALCGFVGELLKEQALRDAFDSRSEPVPEPDELEEFLAHETRFERLCTDVEERLTGNNSSYVLVFLSDVEKLISRRPRDLRAPSGNGHGPTSDSPWIDPRWERLIRAMTVPRAPGFRLLITSPRPLRLDRRRMPDVRVPLLAPAEAYLYAQSLPDLGRVITDAARGMAGEDERDLVRNVITRAEGHPELLRYADEVAAGHDGTKRLHRLATVDGDQLEQDSEEQIPEAWRRIQQWTVDTLECIPRRDPRHLLLLALCGLCRRHRQLHPDGDDCAPGLLAEVWAGLRVHGQRFVDPVGERADAEGRSTDEERDELRFLLGSLAEDCLIDCVGEADGMHLRIRMQPAVVAAAQRYYENWLDEDGSLRAEVDRIALRHTAGRVKVALRHRTHGRTADLQRLIPEAMPYLERAGDWETWLHFVAVRMSRSRRGRRGLDDSVRKLERVTAAIRDKESDQFTMAHRLSGVFKALGRGDRPGLSALLGEGPGDAVVDNSPLAMAMSVGILSGLRDTGRLAEAREVAQDYLQFVESGIGAGLVAGAVEVELLRVLVDEGELAEALGRIEVAFEELADVRFRDAVRTRWADGEILRRKLFTIRRDIHVLLAETAVDELARNSHVELARADHERLGQYLLLEGHDRVERHLHTVEACLLGLDSRLEGDREALEEFDQELMGCLQEVERSGDVIVRAMTDAARAQVQRQQALRIRDLRGEEAWHTGMQRARDYELKALRLLYAQGTPMDIGACHRRIANDQRACQHEPLRRSTPAHHMYAGLLGRLTGAHILRPRSAERAGEARPATVEELCERIGEDLFTEGDKPVPGALDPESLLRKIAADDAQVERAFQEISADS